MQRVSISHCAYRTGVARPSLFIDDIPAESRVVGWLHGERVPTATEMRMERKRRTDEELAAFLRRHWRRSSSAKPPDRIVTLPTDLASSEDRFARHSRRSGTSTGFS